MSDFIVVPMQQIIIIILKALIITDLNNKNKDVDANLLSVNTFEYEVNTDVFL